MHVRIPFVFFLRGGGGVHCQQEEALILIVFSTAASTIAVLPKKRGAGQALEATGMKEDGKIEEHRLTLTAGF